MSYLGDIRENSIGPNGELWEGDNRVEERHYWNGAFIDLCNLSAEDYAKTIFVTSGSGNADTPSKQNNPITVQQVTYTDENGEQVYAYKAVAKQPVTSEVVVEMTVRDEFGGEETVVITVPVGSSTSEAVPTRMPMMMSRPPQVVTSDYNPKEDDKFEYDTVLPEEAPILPTAYTITMIAGKIDTISDEELVTKLRENGEIAMKDATTSERFTVEFTPVPVVGLEGMTKVSEITEALINNASDIILVTDKSIKSIEQADVAGINELSLWVKRGESVQIDGKLFDVWYKRDEGQTSQSRICDSVNQAYVLGAEPRDYIIYYE